MSSLLISLGAIAPILAHTIAWLPKEEYFSTWFQRSGSIMVVFEIMSQSILLSMHSTIYPGENTWVDENHQTNVNQYKKIYDYLLFFSSLLTIVGTIIWGYGDIIIKNY